MTQFPSDFSRLSVADLNALIDAITEERPAADLLPLHKEIRLKTLMELLPGLTRQMAITITSEHPCAEKAAYSDLGRRVGDLAVKAKLSLQQVENLLIYAGPLGDKVIRVAIDRFRRDPTQVARNQLVEMFLLDVQDAAEKAEEPPSGNSIDKAFRAACEKNPGLKLDEWMEQEWDITCPEDFEMMLDAMHCIRKLNQAAWLQSDRSTQNALTQKARNLYLRARQKECPPSKLLEWEEISRNWSESRANTLFIRPWDGQAVWGNGDPAVPDGKGGFMRTMPTIFGKDKQVGTAPMDFEMRDFLKRHYPKS